MPDSRTNPHHGSSFESCLREEGTLEETDAEARRRVAEWQAANHAPGGTPDGEPLSPFGSSFDSFLEEHGILDEVHAAAIPDVQAMQAAVGALEARLAALPSLAADPAHDAGHVARVLRTAREIAALEGSHDPFVLTAAAMLHDCVSMPKDHPRRAMASRLAAEHAAWILPAMDFPVDRIPGVVHAIEAHSFSAGIATTTPEARALQDADRIDALGAVGIARCFAVSGSLGRALFHPTDPLAGGREPDEAAWALDHFLVKLLRLPGTMTTEAGKAVALERAGVMRSFMAALALEATGIAATCPVPGADELDGDRAFDPAGTVPP